MISETNSESETKMCKENTPLDPRTGAVKPGLLSRSLRRIGGGVQLLSFIGHIL